MKKEILEKKLEEIHIIIKDKYENNDEIGILSGLSGITLFQFYYSKYLNTNDDHSNLAVKMLETCISKINRGSYLPTYCSGICGLGWTLTHLAQENFIEIDSNNLLIELDDYLYNLMVFDMKNGRYDFLHGGIGYAFYFLNKYRNTSSDKLKIKYKLILLEFIDLLEKSSQYAGENKLKWLSIIPKNGVDDGEVIEVYNLNLSHGMSSIVGILTKLCFYEDFKSLSEKMLQKSINYILDFKSQDEKSFSLFPGWIEKTGEIKNQSRLGWCYGDVSIGLRLWYASNVLNNEELKEESIAIMKHSAKRMSPKKSLVIDAGVCHGSFGNAQMFHRIFKETDDNVFKKAADYWFLDGMEKAAQHDGFVGHKKCSFTDIESFKTISLLDGIAGIGLAIIDYIGDFDSDWDECLMIGC